VNLVRWAQPVLVAVGAVVLPLSAQLNAWADERNDLVRDGAKTAATASYALARDGESLLADGGDTGLRVTVDGDLATAGHVAVLVPGVDTDAAQFDAPESLTDRDGQPIDWWKTMPGWARSLRLAAAESAPGGFDDLAVVAWLGYRPPAAWAGATAGAMEQGAANLVAFEQFLNQARPDAEVTWVCHSYGSLVCAAALVEVDPDALVLVGSPGVGVAKASQLSTEAPVWAGQTGKDLIGLVQLTGIFGGAFGVLPASEDFGAQSLPCDSLDGHSGYFRPGSSQVRAMGRIVMGSPAAAAGESS
jgi:hypothetical protein